MRCETCIDIEGEDGIAPGCKTEKGCPVPPLSPAERRILEMRGMLRSLSGRVDAGTVLRMHRVSLEDLRVLALIEEGLKEKK